MVESWFNLDLILQNLFETPPKKKVQCVCVCFSFFSSIDVDECRETHNLSPAWSSLKCGTWPVWTTF